MSLRQVHILFLRTTVPASYPACTALVGIFHNCRSKSVFLEVLVLSQIKYFPGGTTMCLISAQTLVEGAVVHGKFSPQENVLSLLLGQAENGLVEGLKSSSVS